MDKYEWYFINFHHYSQEDTRSTNITKIPCCPLPLLSSKNDLFCVCGPWVLLIERTEPLQRWWLPGVALRKRWGHGFSTLMAPVAAINLNKQWSGFLFIYYLLLLQLQKLDAAPKALRKSNSLLVVSSRSQWPLMLKPIQTAHFLFSLHPKKNNTF